MAQAIQKGTFVSNQSLPNENPPSILHFNGLGMRNLQYEVRICQKTDNKVTKKVYVWVEWIRR